MIDMPEDEEEDDTVLLAPDNSLFEKMGKPNLDQVFSPEILKSAQQAIVDAAGSLMDEVRANFVTLKQQVASLDQAPQRVPQIRDLAFSIKSQTGLSNYNLVSDLAKSLQLYCEGITPTALTARDREIIKWHVQSIEMLLTKDIKGEGGDFGTALRGEIEKLQVLSKTSA